MCEWKMIRPPEEKGSQRFLSDNKIQLFSLLVMRQGTINLTIIVGGGFILFQNYVLSCKSYPLTIQIQVPYQIEINYYSESNSWGDITRGRLLFSLDRPTDRGRQWNEVQPVSSPSSSTASRLRMHEKCSFVVLLSQEVVHVCARITAELPQFIIPIEIFQPHFRSCQWSGRLIPLVITHVQHCGI